MVRFEITFPCKQLCSDYWFCSVDGIDVKLNPWKITYLSSFLLASINLGSKFKFFFICKNILLPYKIWGYNLTLKKLPNTKTAFYSQLWCIILFSSCYRCICHCYYFFNFTQVGTSLNLLNIEDKAVPQWISLSMCYVCRKRTNIIKLLKHASKGWNLQSCSSSET